MDTKPATFIETLAHALRQREGRGLVAAMVFGWIVGLALAAPLTPLWAILSTLAALLVAGVVLRNSLSRASHR